MESTPSKTIHKHAQNSQKISEKFAKLHRKMETLHETPIVFNFNEVKYVSILV